MTATSQTDAWVNSVSTACPLSTGATIHSAVTPEILQQVEHRLHDTLGILGVVEDDGVLYLGITSKHFGNLGTSLRGLAGLAAKAFDIESNNITPHGHIYAIDEKGRPVTDKNIIKSQPDSFRFCRLFRIRGRR